jgi:phage/plasmid-associated DNA primase
MSKENIVKLVDAAIADDPLTEDALALRFSERHAQDLRYIALRAQWFKWDGLRWRPERRCWHLTSLGKTVVKPRRNTPSA